MNIFLECSGRKGCIFQFSERENLIYRIGVHFNLNQEFRVQIQAVLNYLHIQPIIYVLTLYITKKNKEGGFSMRDLKTYLSVAPVLSTLWFGALAGLLIEINRLFPDALTFPFFSFQLLTWEGVKKIRERIKRSVTNHSPSFLLDKIELDTIK